MASSAPVRRVYPDSGESTVQDALSELSLRELAPADRPYVIVNFAATVDGHATIGGVSGKIGSGADTEMLMGLREQADAVLVGAGTIRAERYGRLLPEAERRSRRESVGLPSDPLAVIVSGELNIPWDIGLFAEGGEVLLVTSASAEIPDTQVSIEVDRHDGRIDMRRALRALRRERGVRLLLCEGGPRLHGGLQAEGLVDELFLTIGPILGGGDGPRIVEGEIDPPIGMKPAWLLEADGELFARYQVEA